MSKLDSRRLEEIIIDCLYKEGEDTSSHVKAEGLMSTFGFKPEKIAEHDLEIGEMLAELPNEFQPVESDGGGGWSFLNACMDKHGNHWAEHPTIEKLLVLGIAAGRARILMPRVMWSALPGGMPYFGVIAK